MKTTMRRVEGLQVRSRPRILGALLLSIAFLLSYGLILMAQQAVERRLAEYSERIIAAEAEDFRVVSRSAATSAEVIPATVLAQLSQQVELINRDWSRLLQSMVPDGADVRLLSVDVDPLNGSVRLSGTGSSAEQANAYSALLEERAVVGDVRLLTLERNGSRTMFEVTARWIE